MLNAFLQHIQKEQLFKLSGTVLLTVSGGIDSIVMCELFYRAKIKFAIAHCNFQLRAEESEQDEAFVEALAEKYGAAFHSATFETNAFAKKNKLSVQAAARKLRYDWFELIRQQYKYSAIATAHHRDDSIETFFINLIRGTGIAGLHGILPKQGKIVRPLLFTNKESISAFAKKNKLEHREDSSNASDKYLRNNIRNTIIPQLKKLNPVIENGIARDIERLRDVEIIYRQSIEKKRKRIVRSEKNVFRISIGELKKLNPAATYLYEFLKPFHFNSASADEIMNVLDMEAGKQFFSETHRLVKDRNYLLIEEKNRQEKKSYSLSKTTKSVQLSTGKLKIKTIAKTEDFILSKSPATASIDYDMLTFPLEIRAWQKGDIFQPLGMKGKKKLSDFFIDKKLSLFEKENVRVLVSGGQIVWLIGYRMDGRFAITGKTKKIYFVELSPVA